MNNQKHLCGMSVPEEKWVIPDFTPLVEENTQELKPENRPLSQSYGEQSHSNLNAPVPPQTSTYAYNCSNPQERFAFGYNIAQIAARKSRKPSAPQLVEYIVSRYHVFLVFFNSNLYCYCADRCCFKKAEYEDIERLIVSAQ